MSEFKENDIELMDEDKAIDREIKTSLRNAFIKKVYGIIFFQLLITTAVVYYVMTNDFIINFMINYYPILYVCLIFEIAIILICGCTKLARQVPLNYILLITFTILEAISISYTTLYFEPLSVLTAAGLTMLIVLGLTLYAWTSKTDLTMHGGIFLTLSLILCFLGIIGIFFRSYFYQCFLCCFGVLLMSIYLIYDTQLVIGNKKNLISMDLYIIAAMMIYLDVINIFLYILRLFGKKK